MYPHVSFDILCDSHECRDVLCRLYEVYVKRESKQKQILEACYQDGGCTLMDERTDEQTVGLERHEMVVVLSLSF